MITSRFLFALILAVVINLSACASRPLSIDNAAEVDVLGICLNFNEYTHEDVKLLYLNAIKELVDQVRQDGSTRYSIDTCKRDQPYQLNILVQNSNFIDPSEQVFYVLLSTAGIMYPLSGGGIGFFWLGLNSTGVEISLSDALSGDGKPVYEQVYSFPYFMDSESVRLHHMESFKQMILDAMRYIDNQLVNKPRLKSGVAKEKV